MTSYALFLGCTIPARQPNYELSARKSLEKLGIELVEMNNTTCCAPPPIESVDLKSSLALAAYNVCLAEEQDLDVVALCNGCFQSLAKANSLLKQDEHLRKEINIILSRAGKEFQGNKEVKHYLQVLIQDVGIEKIRKNVVKPLYGLRVASFYGCHIIRPSSYLQFDDAERPRILDDLVEATYAKSIDYKNKLKCCGGLLRGHADDLSTKMAQDKVINISNAKVDCSVTVCPFCYITLDFGQIYSANPIPVLHYSELLCLALGIDSKEITIQNRRSKADKILKIIG
jgi:heterodisulfide reductase subunit B